MPRSPHPPKRSDTFYAWGVSILLVIAVGLIYGQTLDYGFLGYDDDKFVSANPHVTPGLTADGLWWGLTKGPLGEWYPLTVFSHMLDCQLFGLEVWGHRLHNLLLHAATAIALFLFWWRLTGELWPSAFVAAVFAVHPQHVESVAWLSERKDVLSGLFFVLTLCAYLGYVRHGRSGARYALVALLFALGLLAKPMIVTLPGVLLLLDFWPLSRIGTTDDAPAWSRTNERPGAVWLVVEKLPLVALAIGDSLMTLGTHAQTKEVPPWPVRSGSAVVSCVKYIWQMFDPRDLAAFYPLPREMPPAWQIAAAAAMLILASVAAVIGRRRFPYGFVGWYWYLGMLAPVLGILEIGDLAMADRYMYLPSIGLSVALAWGVARWGNRLGARQWMLGAAAALVIALLTAYAARQATFWFNEEVLWQHAIEVTTDNGRAELYLAHWLANHGRLEEAIPHYRRVIEIMPDSFSAEIDLAAALALQNQLPEALAHLHRAMQLDPHGVEGFVFLARMLFHEGEAENAFAVLDRAMAAYPNDSTTHSELGMFLAQQGNTDKAIAQFDAALKIAPDAVQAHIGLASALAEKGERTEALKHYRRALELEPNNPYARIEFDRLSSEAPGQESSP